MSPYIHIYLFIYFIFFAKCVCRTQMNHINLGWVGCAYIHKFSIAACNLSFFRFCSRTMFRLHKNQPLIPNCITNHQSFILPQLLVTCMICTRLLATDCHCVYIRVSCHAAWWR